MTLTIKYFGLIAEKTGKREEVVNLDDEDFDVESLKRYCFSKYKLQDMQAVQVAVNHSIQRSGPLKNGDEVAFLPPYAGG